MRKGKVFFHPIEGSGTLTISWSSHPKGDAIEAKKGDGVGFFSESGDLLCVLFDEVHFSQDRQSLEFDRYYVEIVVKNGKVTHSIVNLPTQSLARKKRVKRKSTIK